MGAACCGNSSSAYEQASPSSEVSDPFYDAPPELPSRVPAKQGGAAPAYVAAVGGNWARCPACRTRHGPDGFCTGARRKSLDGAGFLRNETYEPTKMVGAEPTPKNELSNAKAVLVKVQKAARRHTTGGMGLHAAIDALQAGDHTLASEITGELRKNKDRVVDDETAKKTETQKADAATKKKDLQEREHLQFRKAQAIAGGAARRSSLPNILSALGEDEGRRTAKANAFTKQRRELEEIQRADGAEMPWYRQTSSTAKDEHGRRLSVSLQAVQRRNSYSQIPMASAKILRRGNPTWLPEEATGPRVARLFIHS